MNHLFVIDYNRYYFMFKVTLLMFELYSCMEVSLNATQDEVINGRRVVGREGGCAGHSRLLELGVMEGDTHCKFSSASVCVTSLR